MARKVKESLSDRRHRHTMKPTSDPYLEPEPPVLRWAILALLLSLLLHVALAWWLGWIRLPDYAIPYQQQKYKKPFQLKRVDMNPNTLQGTPNAGVSAVPVARDPNPSPQNSSDGRSIARALLTNPPQMAVPTTPDPVNAAITDNPATSPYSPSDKARIESEIARINVGALNLNGPDQAAGGTPIPTNTGGSGPTAGPGGVAGLPGPPTAGGDALPSFEQISAGFRSPNAGLNPKMPEPVMLRLPSDVVFDFDSSHIKPAAEPLLMQAVEWIRKYPVARIQVEGHTDTFGSDAYNQKLSEDRAREAVTWLKQQLTGNQYTFESRGFGKTRPLVNPQGTIDEQQRNRRVEIVIQAINP